MRCRVFDLIYLLGMAIAAHATEPEDRAFLRNTNQPAVQIVQLDTVGSARVKPFLLILSIVPVPSSDAAPFRLGFDDPGRLPATVEKKKEIAWAANANWPEVLGRDRASLVPHLRLELNGERVEIRPRRHSLSLEWRKGFN